MRTVLFCENRYAIDILYPLALEARGRGYEILWYIHAPKIASFPYADSFAWTGSIQQVKDFSPEAVFVPGNIVPYYLPGVKVQVFHGYAAEKKDHWVIRRYFDTYFTQGPYFTEHFRALAKRYGDFEVVETGWTKQDWIQRNLHAYDEERESLLKVKGKKRIVLYAPTFSPKLTSLSKIKAALARLARDMDDVLIVMKFHPLTRTEWVEEYTAWANENPSFAMMIDKGDNVTRWQLMSDLVISDTSSAVYEFLLLDRPVVTLDTIAKDIYWENITDASLLTEACERAFADPASIERRRWVLNNYDPYIDGKCCARMLDAAADYIRRHGVPSKRRLNLWRKYTSIKIFGKVK